MGSPTQSAVIRARYSSDVNGINRYKHFHSPMQLPISLFALSPINNNIDGKYSPSGSSLLPKISPIPLRRSTGRKKVIVQSVKIQSALRKQKSTVNNGKLPQLSNSSPISPPFNLNVTGTKKPLQKRQSRSSNSDSSSTFLVQSAPTKVFQNVISNEKLPNLPRSYSANQLQKIKPPKDSKVAKTQTISNESQPKIIRQKHHVPSKSLASKKHAKTCGTQTEEVSNLEILKSVSLNGTNEPIHEAGVVQRSTQTDRIFYFENDEKKLIDSTVLHKMGERSQLYEIIDNALDETIDRNSRMRANKMIASTAKQQAEVWRDAKEFVTKVLLPSSISLANQSRSSRSPRSPLQRMIENWDQKF